MTQAMLELILEAKQGWSPGSPAKVGGGQSLLVLDGRPSSITRCDMETGNGKPSLRFLLEHSNIVL